MSFLRRLWFVLTRARRDADLRDEMRLHLELRAAKNARHGRSDGQAARQARVRFGNPLKLREDSRDTWGFVMLEQTLKDIRYSARQLWRRRTWTLTVVLTLAIGVGATSAVFELIDALLLRPGIGDQPDRLVWLASVTHPGDGVVNVSYPDYLAYRDHAKTLAATMAFSGAEFSIAGHDADRVYGDIATGNYFDVLRVPAARGRALTPADDRPGAAPVVVIGDTLWRAHFAADPGVIGQTVRVNGTAVTLVGVMPAGFLGAELGKDVELWVPLSLQPVVLPDFSKGLTNADSHSLRVMARLAEGAAIDRANAEVNVIAASLRPPDLTVDRRPTALVASTTGGLHPANRNGLTMVLSLIGVVPVLVLLVACANVANVVMAQNVSRQREFAMRRAIGASRARIVRLLLVETALLGVLAAGAGLAVSEILTAVVMSLGQLPSEVTMVLHTNARVIVGTVAIALGATGLYGLLPAMAATRFDLVAAIKEQGGAVAGSARQGRLRGAFVVTQIAVSLTLVIATGLFVRSLAKALQVDPGFVARGAVSVTVDPDLLGYGPGRRAVLTETLVERASSLPGVSAAGVTSLLPLGSVTRWRTVSATDGTHKVQALDASVSPGYFAAMGIPIVAGRGFSANDRAGTRSVIVVNETLARRLWPDQSLLGHQLADRGFASTPLLDVVGIVPDGKYSSLDEEPTAATYVPVAQRQMIGSPLSLVVRSPGDEALLLRSALAAVKDVDPDLPPYRAEPLTVTLSGAAEDRRAAAALVGVLGVMALAIAAIGIYGVAAHSVSLRRREVGIRMAIGARPSDVSRLFVRHTLGLAAIGVGLGTATSAAASRILSSYLFGLGPNDAVTFVGAAAATCAIAAAASYIPARQAARLNPVVALKND